MLKEMKYFFLFAIMLFTATVFAQFQERFLNNVQQSGVNFFDIQAKADAYYTAFPDTNENGGQRNFERWEYFWSNRVSSPDNTISGTYSPALKALQTQMQAPICSVGPNMANWVNLGPGTSVTPMTNQVVGIVTAVAFDPQNSTTYYAGTSNSGLWKTSNSGASWQCLTENLRLPGLGINDVAIDPTDHNTIYIATGISRGGSYGLGVLKTTNGGMSWTTNDLTFNPSSGQALGITQKIVIDPNSPNIIYALVDDKVFKSTDGGATWPSSSGSSPSYTLCMGRWECDPNPRKLIDIEMHPTNSSILYISSNDLDDAAGSQCGSNCANVPTKLGANGGAELWRTTDVGGSWIELTAVTSSSGSSPLFASNPAIFNSDRISVAVSPADPSSIFLSYSLSGSTIAYYQKYDGPTSTWLAAMPINANVTTYDSPGGATGLGYFSNTLVVSPTINTTTNKLDLYLAGYTVMKSTDDGANWSQVSDYWPYNLTSSHGKSHGDVRALVIDNTGNILMGNDGGAGYSANGATTWTNISTKLPIAQFFGLACTEKNPSIIIGGTQDNGLYTYNGINWIEQVQGIGDACKSSA
jgi:hypothetical protein